MKNLSRIGRIPFCHRHGGVRYSISAPCLHERARTRTAFLPGPSVLGILYGCGSHHRRGKYRDREANPLCRHIAGHHAFAARVGCLCPEDSRAPARSRARGPVDLKFWRCVARRWSFLGLQSASARWLFAISLVVFGTQHFLYAKFVATLVPSWIPGHLFWAYFVGVAFVAAALAIAIEKNARLAATLLGLMFFLWVVSLHLPRVAAARSQRGRMDERFCGSGHVWRILGAGRNGEKISLSCFASLPFFALTLRVPSCPWWFMNSVRH